MQPSGVYGRQAFESAFRNKGHFDAQCTERSKTLVRMHDVVRLERGRNAVLRQAKTGTCGLVPPGNRMPHVASAPLKGTEA
jgi:hypothetical protein